MTHLEFYLRKPETTWRQVAKRVSQTMPLESQQEIEHAIANRWFFPGTPILRNAGSSKNMASCHTWAVEDGTEGTMGAVAAAARVFESGGGGIGFDLSSLQPRGQLAIGPLGFWSLFTTVASVISDQNAGKPNAAMGTLNWAHADAKEWATCKKNGGRFETSTLSVTVDAWDDLPRIEKMTIAKNAWHNGDPGVVFLDNVNRDNLDIEKYGRMTTANVCSEVFGWHKTSCFLASLNLPAVVQKLGDWDRLRQTARLQTQFLDRIVDINHYPDRGFWRQAQAMRQLGVGWMGWNTLLKREGIQYASRDCNDLANEIGSIIAVATHTTSWELATKKKGYTKERKRNYTLRAIAPTGHLAPFAGVSPSVCLDFNDPAQYAQSLQLSPTEHLRHLAIWASHVDGGISYTLPLRNSTKPEEVLDALDLAHSLGIKSLSVYRDKSKSRQPCTTDTGMCSS